MLLRHRNKMVKQAGTRNSRWTVCCGSPHRNIFGGTHFRLRRRKQLCAKFARRTKILSNTMVCGRISGEKSEECTKISLGRAPCEKLTSLGCRETLPHTIIRKNIENDPTKLRIVRRPPLCSRGSDKKVSSRAFILSRKRRYKRMLLLTEKVKAQRW